MIARFHSWWQQIKQHRVAIGVGAIILVAAIVLVIIEIKLFGTGFTGKTLWDWLQLLIIPLVLAVVALLFNHANTRTEQNIALDKQREDLLQTYLDCMSELLLEKGLATKPADEARDARNLARVRTITILFQLDARRIGYVITFLRETRLMSTKPNSSIVSLSGADLRKINLSEADLREINLSEAYLSEANLSNANLKQANLSNAHFASVDLAAASNSELMNTDDEANLSGASFYKADLSYAFLSGANLRHANLRNANLTGAYLTNADLRAFFESANLSEAHLREANLRGAYFGWANLSGADLSGADLSGASFYKADLSGANLLHANLREAKITEEQLAKAKSLEGATMPDGSIHP